MNSPYDIANERWMTFKGSIGVNTFPRAASITYKTKRGAGDSKPADFVVDGNMLKGVLK